MGLRATASIDYVIADKFVPASQLCKGKYSAECAAAGISG